MSKEMADIQTRSMTNNLVLMNLLYMLEKNIRVKNVQIPSKPYARRIRNWDDDVLIVSSNRMGVRKSDGNLRPIAVSFGPVDQRYRLQYLQFPKSVQERRKHYGQFLK